MTVPPRSGDVSDVTAPSGRETGVGRHPTVQSTGAAAVNGHVEGSGSGAVREAVGGAIALACPACDQPQSVSREICGDCGVDLDTATVSPWPSRPDRPRVPAVVAEPRVRWGRGWWPLAVMGVVTVGVVAGLFIAGVGPFARAVPPPPPVELDGDAYVDPRVVLELTDIATVTVSPPADGRDFSPVQMVDDDPTTAWRSLPLQPDGQREIIDLYLAEPSWVEMLLVNNGDQFDADSYGLAARVHRALVTFDGGIRYVVDLLDVGRIPQAVELPAPVLTTTMRIEIVEVFPGSTDAGVAISDLELRGRIAADEDADEAIARAQAWPATGTGF